MAIQQISISLENVPGKLSEVSEILGKNGINIIAISVVDAADISSIRIVANNPEKASEVLKSNNFNIHVTEVLAAETPNHPGGLNAILKPLKERNINVSYLYPVLGTGDKTILIVGVDNLEAAEEVLKQSWVKLVGDELYRL